MVLGYYKFLIKEFIAQSIRKFKLRKNNYIGKKCHITKDAVLKGNNRIGDYCRLGPNVRLGENVRVGSLARISNITVKENSWIDSGAVCTGFGNGKIIIGKESYIGLYNILDFSDSITIGDYVHIAGPSTGLWTHSSAQMCLNSIPLKEKRKKHRSTAPIIIEDNVYIGGNCTIYPGITIGHHSIIAPNSAVTKDVEPYSQVGGVPAKLLKKLEKKAIQGIKE
jgi:acetyltransferase-like isoleucine patch superfamily enzyme